MELEVAELYLTLADVHRIRCPVHETFCGDIDAVEPSL